MNGIPFRAWVYVAVVICGATATALGEARAHGIPDVGVILGFGLLFLLAELAPISFRHGTYSVSYVLVIAAVIALGPAGAAMAAAFTALDTTARKRPDG